MKFRKIFAVILAATLLFALSSCGVEKVVFTESDGAQGFWVQSRGEKSYDVDSAAVQEIIRLYNEAELVGKAENENPVIGYGIAIQANGKSISLSQFEGDKFIVKGSDIKKPYVIISAELNEYMGQLNAAD